MGREIWGGTRNGDHHLGKAYIEAQLAAAGYQRPRPNQQARFNGGVVAHREVRLVKGDKLFRFCGSRVTRLEDQVRGCWWFDQDMCILLWSLCDGTGNGFRQAARTMLAILPEWSDLNFCVSAHLKADFWAIRGTTARAQGSSDTFSNHHGHESRQLYIPGGLDKDALASIKPVALTRAVY